MTQPDIKALEESIAWVSGFHSLDPQRLKARKTALDVLEEKLQSLKAGTLTVQELEGMKLAPPEWGTSTAIDSHNAAIDKAIGRVKNVAI
jgi:hypothetical protein